MSPPSVHNIGSPCQCPASATPTILHSLFHRTTRTPLLVHPALWSVAHLDLLRVVVSTTTAPAPSTAPPDGQGFAALVPFHILDDYLCAQQYDTAPPYAAIVDMLTNAFQSLPGAFNTDTSPLTLEIGSISASLTPCAFASRTSLPFAGLTSPLQRIINRKHHHHHRRCPPPVHPPVHPSDIALLLALAQRQHLALPDRTSYTVHVLAPDETGYYVRGLSAEVDTTYILALKDPSREIGELCVQSWDLAIDDTGEGIGRVVWAIGENAIRLKKLLKLGIGTRMVDYVIRTLM